MKPFAYNIIKIDKWDGSDPIKFLEVHVNEFKKVKGMKKCRSIKVPKDLYLAYMNLVCSGDAVFEQEIKRRKFLLFRGIFIYEPN